MKLPITRTMQSALDWLTERDGICGYLGGRYVKARLGEQDEYAPFRPSTWRKLLERGFVRTDDFGHLVIVPIDPPLDLSAGDIEESVVATRKQAETFKAVRP